MSSHNVIEELRKADQLPGATPGSTSVQLAYGELSSTTCAADVLVIPITHAYVAKTTGDNAEAGTLADGTPGQILTVSLVAEGGAGGNMSLEPDTKSGFVSVELDELGDTVTFMYVDDTVGWIILGVVGVAAAPLIALS